MERGTRRLRWLVVLVLIVVPVAVYIPVHQAALHRELAFEITQLEREIQQLEEQIRMLNVEVAELESPDRLIDIVEHYTDVKKADEENLVVVTEEESAND
ncbi:MAG: hypothetical protein ACQEQU_07900 [Spirochaetota bacterium]